MTDNVITVEGGDSIDTVLQRLTEAVAWCAPRVNVHKPKECLRAAELQPHSLAGSRRSVVESVASERYIALNRPPKQPAKNLSGGRLLIYEPDINLAHGLEELETEGYVDANNVPPWDTWIAYLFEPARNYLLSWAPPEFIPLVSAGINVCPEMCFQWLDETDLQIRPLLRQRGLSGA